MFLLAVIVGLEATARVAVPKIGLTPSLRNRDAGNVAAYADQQAARIAVL